MFHSVIHIPVYPSQVFTSQYVQFGHLQVSLTPSDTNQSASPLRHLPVTLIHSYIRNQYVTLCSFLQVSCHNGAIPLDSVARSHPNLPACHFPHCIFLQPFTKTPAERPLAGGEYVLVCIWHIHQLLHIQGRVQLEQLWQSSHKNAYWWVNSAFLENTFSWTTQDN